MTSPRSVRFEPHTLSKLTAFADRHPGLSTSSAAAMLVEEGLRMAEHPGVVFRDGPSGRRAGLIQGPDVWEVIAVVRNVRAANSRLAADELIDEVSKLTDRPGAQIRAAVDYYSAYPDEIDTHIQLNEAAEAELKEKLRRTSDLLGT